MPFQDFKFSENKPVPSKSDYLRLRSNVFKEKKISSNVPIIKIFIDQITINDFEIESVAEFIKNDKPLLNVIKADCERFNLIEKSKKKQLNIIQLLQKKK